MTSSIITFEHNGFPVELVNARDIQRAIASGRLRADTIVTVHGSDGSVVTRRADSVDLLREHLGIAEPKAEPEPAAVPEPPAMVEAEPPPVAAQDALAAPAPDIREMEIPQSPPEQSVPPATPAPPAGREPTAKPLAVIVGGAAATVLVIALFSGGRGGSPAYVEPANTTSENMTMTDAGPAVRVIGTPQTYYAARPVKVRAQATGGSAELGALGRGDSIRGVMVARESDNEEWVRVESGPHSGSFVWRRNLADSQPPSLLRTVSEPRNLPISATLYARPEDSATTLQSLDSGTSVQLAGELTSGWWEVELSTGGVGYLRPNAFDVPGRFVRIWNTCPDTIYLQLTYQSRDGPEDSSGTFWTIDSGGNYTIQHQHRNIEAVADNFSYRLTDYRGNPRSESRRANTYIDDDGYYMIRFNCDN